MVTFISIILFLFFFTVSTAQNPVDIGVILDLGSPVGQTCHVSINLALSDYYTAYPNSTTKLRLHFRHAERSDVVSAASAAIDLISSEKVTAILGPQTSSPASFVSDIGARCHVPVVSFSASSPSVSPAKSPYFVRAAIIATAASAPIASLIKYYGWRRVVPIYEDSDYGSSFVPFLVDALNAVGSKTPYRVSIPVSASDGRMLVELYRLKTMQTRVFVVHVTPVLAARFFINVKKAGMMEKGFVWIVTDGLTCSIGSNIDSSVVSDMMQGVVGIKPCIRKSEKLKKLKLRWRREFLKENPSSDIVDISTFGIWAYDAVFALAMAAELAHPVSSSTNIINNTSNTDLLKLPILATGPKFLDSLHSVKFEGLAGRFTLEKGELKTSAFRIVNIIGEKGHSAGIWTDQSELTQGLDRLNNDDNAGLGTITWSTPIIWPGGTTEIPKGFVDPTTKDKLKIAVPGPVEPGFHAFLNVQKDLKTNETTASGYVIEVFEAAVKRLPYALPFEYVAYIDEHGKSAGDYNSLVKQVPQKYDAVVGDVTITALRANFVDFTMPYTVSGVSVLVPLKEEHSTSAWIFLKPLKTELWLASGLFFVFTGIVIWVIEHRINEEFRGSPSHQFGTVFYFTFSTLVFSHKETLVSNLSRIIIVVWVFVVLILQSSYTANLTSMLTVKQLHPTVLDINELLKTNENVGYLQNSFVKGFLLNKGFHESRLMPFKSPQQYAEAFAKGSKKGGIGAVVDEIPYLKVFLKDYCANYTMTGMPNKTGGFGFVFPKGSSIVSDLSQAILNLTESDEMAQIERRWFGDQTTCANDDGPFSSKSLNFVNFWGLFLITGIASTISLLIYLITFVSNNKEELIKIASDTSLKWRRVQSVVKLYDEKDLSSHTFRRDSVLKHRSMATGIDSSDSPSHYNINIGSPLSLSHHTFDDGRVSVDLTSSMPETPTHIEMTTSYA